MLPDSSLPGNPSPSPHKRLPTLRRGLMALAVALVITGFVGAFLVVHGAGNSPHLASGPAATATTAMTAITTTTGGTVSPTGTTTPGLTPVPTATSGDSSQPVADVRVTKNQDMRLACLDDSAPYTVTLYNAGNVAANWHVNVPGVFGDVTNPGSQPLISPLSSYPFWADPSPQDGTVAPGQTVNFVMNVRWSVPCSGSMYHAAVQLSFPSGASQADIPLTYAGTGPAPYSNVVLVSGSLSMTEACPASGSAPAPFTFAIKNTGNYKNSPSVDNTKDEIGLHLWADVTSFTIDPQEPDTHWLYPGETWTFTLAPSPYVRCDGTVYHIYVFVSNIQGTTQAITITDTFH